MKTWTKAELKALFEEWWATKMERSTVVAPSEETEALDTIQGQAGGDDDSDGSMPLLRAEPFGFFGVPMPNQPCITFIRRGDNGVVICIGNSRYRPSNTKRGEAGLYCAKEGTTIWLKQNGEVRINAGASQNVVVNDGTKSVARVDDTVDAGTLLLIAPMGILGAAQYFPAGTPLPSPLPTGAIAVKLGNGKITTGADRFKA